MVCKDWLKNKLVNPKSGRKIKKDGPTYKNLEKKCSEKKKTPTKQAPKTLCEKWREDTLINPETGKKIKKDGPTYKNLEKKCTKKASPFRVMKPEVGSFNDLYIKLVNKSVKYLHMNVPKTEKDIQNLNKLHEKIIAAKNKEELKNLDIKLEEWLDKIQENRLENLIKKVTKKPSPTKPSLLQQLKTNTLLSDTVTKKPSPKKPKKISFGTDVTIDYTVEIPIEEKEEEELRAILLQEYKKTKDEMIKIYLKQVNQLHLIEDKQMRKQKFEKLKQQYENYMSS